MTSIDPPPWSLKTWVNGALFLAAVLKDFSQLRRKQLPHTNVFLGRNDGTKT
ncbi:MAG: hypothetical protein RMY36_030800 [Nostoc sp. SerVER01]|nr:hypothetical protein [Nostoc sp. SerVER01]